MRKIINAPGKSLNYTSVVSFAKDSNQYAFVSWEDQSDGTVFSYEFFPCQVTARLRLIEEMKKPKQFSYLFFVVKPNGSKLDHTNFKGGPDQK